MSWFKIDDGFHCHAKVMAAGTPAVGLYVRCGSWAAQQSSDGIVPKQIARMYGTPRMIKALIEVGLWHQAGHECEVCPELDGNSYAIHEYLERNPSRVAVELERKAKSERQQRWRENKKNPQAKNPETPPVDGDVDASTRHHGDGSPDPTPPVPSHVSPEGDTSSKRASRRGEQPPAEIPEFAGPLIEAMTQHGMAVRWGLGPSEWIAIHSLIKKLGEPAMVEHARRSWRHDDPPVHGRWFLRVWTQLPAIPPDAPMAPEMPTPGTSLAVRGDRQQQASDDMFARAAARAEARMRARQESS